MHTDVCLSISIGFLRSRATEELDGASFLFRSVKMNLGEVATPGSVIIAFDVAAGRMVVLPPYAVIINPRYYGAWALNETQRPPIAVTHDVTSRPIDRFEIISNPFSSSSVFKRYEGAILIKRYNAVPPTSRLLIRAYSENYILAVQGRHSRELREGSIRPSLFLALLFPPRFSPVPLYQAVGPSHRQTRDIVEIGFV